MKLIVPPKGEICDVIILTNSVDEDVYKMTEYAIQSLRASETENNFRVILVESNQNNSFSHSADITLFYRGEFSYNRALNIAFENIQSDYVYVSNNDVVFKENWYSTMRYYMNIFDLDSASPRCPIPQRGPNPLAQQLILSYPEHAVILGFEPIVHFCGWGWLMKRNILETLRPFPEDLTFWYQDNHMGLQLQTSGRRHGCITNSHVIHHGQQSYKYIPVDKMHGMTQGLAETFQRKWQQ